MSVQPGPARRTTVRDFARRKQAGEKLTLLTAYDFTMARLLDACELDAILVGDSLGMVIQGHDTTLPVTLDEMIYHARLVARGTQHAMVVADIPFPGCHTEPATAIQQAARVLKESGCQAVKLEGGTAQANVIAALVDAGIPVMAHVGLRPQSVHQLGGYRVQREAVPLLADAEAAANAGAFSIVLECIPEEVARQITERLSIPTIGIGAGPACDGQILVTYDLLGLTPGSIPRFVKPYAQLADSIREAVQQFRKDVSSGQFPDSAHTLA